VAAAALAAALLALAVGCGSSGGGKGTAEAGNAGKEADVTLRVGETGWGSVQALLRTAGLDRTPYTVKWAVFPGGDKQLQALQAGALDVAESSDIPPAFAAAATAPKWRVVAVARTNTLLQNVVAGKGSRVTSIAGLKGRKVGYVQATTAQFFLDKLLQQAGLKWGDIHAVPLTPEEGVAALDSGSIDALATYGNSVITTTARGAKVIGSGADILSGNFPFEASRKVIADPARSAALVDLLARIDKAYAVVRDGREAAYAKVVAAATHQPQQQALQQFRAGEKQIPSQVVPPAREQIAKEQDVADTFTQLGVLPGRVDVSSYWTDALAGQLTKALAAS
jgi:sulfonate transport system substrate-binding protein